MVNDLWVSFRDTIRTKATNPFLGTLILVWLFKNHKEIYKLFFSGDNLSFDQKLENVQILFHPGNLAYSLLVASVFAFVVIIITYIFLDLSRFLINGNEKIIIPWIHKITDINSVVLKSDYKILEDDRNRLEKKFTDEREKRVKAESSIEDLEKKSNDFQMKLSNTRQELAKAQNTIESFKTNSLRTDLEKSHDERVKELTETTRKDIDKIRDNYENKENQKIYERIKDRNGLKNFSNIIRGINNKKPFKVIDSDLDFFLELDLIKHSSDYSIGTAIYKFTERGEIFKKYFLDIYDKNYTASIE